MRLVQILYEIFIGTIGESFSAYNSGFLKRVCCTVATAKLTFSIQNLLYIHSLHSLKSMMHSNNLTY